MFQIQVECDRGEVFGVLSWKNAVDDNNVVCASLAVSRQLGNPAQFETRKEAESELNDWLRQWPAALDNFSFNVVEAA